MQPDTETKVARLEAFREADREDMVEVKERLGRIEDSLGELNVTMRSAKVTGRVFLGIAAAVGSVIGWFVSLRG